MNEQQVQLIKQNIAKIILDSIDNSEFWVTKTDVAINSGVEATTLYNILGNKSNYTFESLVKICLERGIDSIPIKIQ